MLGMAEGEHAGRHHDLPNHGNESISGNCDSMGFGNMESMSIDDGKCNFNTRLFLLVNLFIGFFILLFIE